MIRVDAGVVLAHPVTVKIDLCGQTGCAIVDNPPGCTVVASITIFVVVQESLRAVRRLPRPKGSAVLCPARPIKMEAVQVGMLITSAREDVMQDLS